MITSIGLKSKNFLFQPWYPTVNPLPKNILATPLELLALNWFSAPIENHWNEASTCQYYKHSLDSSWSELNWFLTDGQINILESCILVLWFKDFYVVDIIQYFFGQPDCRNFLSEHCNTVIKQWGGVIPYKVIQV